MNDSFLEFIVEQKERKTMISFSDSRNHR